MSGAPTREVARRTFAAEFNDANYTFKESDDERAPVYLLLPTGERANRVFVVGTLTEKEDVGEDSEYWRGRVVDPNGDTFFVYAGQYQPDAAAMLRELEAPAYVSIAGKPRTFEMDDGTVNVSLRPESITVVDESTRDRWVVETAERTLERIETFDDETNRYATMAKEQYERPIDTYRDNAIQALESLDTGGASGGNDDGANDESTSDDAGEVAGDNEPPMQ
ncbi:MULTISPECIES: RPA family protein [unclassified Haladaptatus]|uniref:RPA family protein n=1 Tax=unclassified Haladaptatus TaxID=2622732 RepID=UPI00209BC198|nr:MULTISPECIES: RPA family protein [unclassified Haladaptatus]MCO8242638.1 RPA family protein [Haladaptatus sp. AB643]MCO8252398.1 RPA family protein [Haladaptatus sp. AB618]